MWPESGYGSRLRKTTDLRNFPRDEIAAHIHKLAGDYGIQISATEELDRYLDIRIGPHAHGVTLDPDTIVVRTTHLDNVPVLWEEVIHTFQLRANLDEIYDVPTLEMFARQVMVRYRHSLGITNDEVREMISVIRHIRLTGEY